MYNRLFERTQAVCRSFQSIGGICQGKLNLQEKKQSLRISLCKVFSMAELCLNIKSVGGKQGCLPPIGKLSKDVYERRMLTGNGVFAFMGSGFAQISGQITSLTVS